MSAQSPGGFAIFKITRWRARKRDAYWVDPKRDPIPPDTEVYDSTRHFIIDPSKLLE